MAIESSRVVTLTDNDGNEVYDLKLNEQDEVQILQKKFALSPPYVKREELVDAVAKLGEL